LRSTKHSAGLGFIFVTLLIDVLGIGLRIPFWGAAALSFANFAYGWFVLPESLKPENRRAFALSEANPLGALRMLGRYPVVWGLTGALAAYSLAMQCLSSTWVLFMTYRFGWGVQENGYSLAAFGVIALVFQLGLARWLIPAIGERRIMLLSLGFASLECLGYALATQGWMVYAIMVLGGLAVLAGQVTQGLASHQVGEDEQGALQGALTSVSSLCGIVGPVVATYLFSLFTAAAAPVRLPGIPFILGAALNALALGLALRTLLASRRSPAKAGQWVT
jgi:DHA1 family tetracycline resistance protein-like MFS transporter